MPLRTSRVETLRDAGLDSASAIVVTIADEDATEALVAEIRRLSPQTAVFARARDRQHAGRLLKNGASVAVPETIEGSLRLAHTILLEFGTDEDAASKQIELERFGEDA